jgi:hypothetical protein
MLAVAGALLLSSGFAINPANATLFTITSVSFTVGSGYGDQSETPPASATLLDVEFDTSGFVAQSFTLTNALDSQAFLFGTVELEETDAGGGIQAAETDNLGVTAHFVFTSPTGSTQDVIAVGTAVAGSVSDAAVDYTLVWTPTLVNFGTGGVFRIDLANLLFDDQELLNLNATVTLINPSQVNGAPEPATLSLLGLGLAALGIAARKRKRAT